MRMRIIGRRDGKTGLPKEGHGGHWFSPYMEMLNKACAQREDEEFKACAETTAEMQIKAEERAYEIVRHEAVLGELSSALAGSAATEEVLSAMYAGEERLPEGALRARRQREHETRFSGQRVQLAASENFLKSAYAELAVLKAKIAETETDTRLRVERVRANTDERILIYYHAALKVHPLRKDMPPCPKLTDTNAEATYLSSRNAEIERIRKMRQIREAVQNGGLGYETV